MSRARSELSFEVGFARSPDSAPERWVPAQVPGAVQLDWARAEGWGPWHEGENYRDYLWMEDVHWSYRARLPGQPVAPGRSRHLVLLGVDYAFTVWIDGRQVHEQEGMFAPVELDVTGSPPGALVEVRLRPVPKFPGAHRPKAQAARSVKPAVSYGWDFHPRLVPLGIWDEAFVEERPATHLRELDVHYTLSEALDRATGQVRVAIAAPAGAAEVAFRTFDETGALACAGRAPVSGPDVFMPLSVASPRLWWPNGQGEPARYRTEVELLDGAGRVLDARARRHGFRRVRLVMNEGAWDEPSTFPKGRSTPPMTLEVNGRAIFAKGSNWVCPEIFPGLVTPEKTRAQLELARDANLNILRCWGGAIVNKESFFEQCDELGLLVWQEFPLACNDYADDPAYLAVLDRESRAIIRRVAQHPCLALWCGGNELFNVWSGMTDQRKALRLLGSNCLQLDPDTPFLPTSPVMGVGHGDYRFRDERGREVFQVFAQAAFTAYCEFGCPGPADAEVLRAIIPEAERFPPRAGGAWTTRHAFEAWGVAPESWLFPSLIAEYFGPPADLDELVARGQLMQAEGYRCLFEEARRQKPRASMAINWCWNEPWPTAANNSVIGWPCRPKPAWAALRDACRPVLASARIPKFSWHAGELFTAELALLCDSPAAPGAGTLRAFLRQDGRETELLSWTFQASEPNRNLIGPVARAVLPRGQARLIELILRVDGRPEWDSTYRLCFRPGVEPRRTVVGFINNA